MQTVNIHQAKTQFSRLVDAATGGEEIVIAKAGKPVARLMPMERVKVARRFGHVRSCRRTWDNPQLFRPCRLHAGPPFGLARHPAHAP